MSLADDEATRRLTRDVARRSVEQLGEGLTRVAGETSALHRWLLTMLVALNGAGILLCFSIRKEIAAAPLGQILLVFFAGIMTALLAALVGMLLAPLVSRSMRGAIAHWTDVSVSGDLSEDALASARAVRRAGSLWLAASSFVGLVSLALFLIGASTVGEQLFFPVAKKAPVAVRIPEPTPANAAQEPVSALPANESQPSPAPARKEPVAAVVPDKAPMRRQAKARPPRPPKSVNRQAVARMSKPAPSKGAPPMPRLTVTLDDPSTSVSSPPVAAASPAS